MFKPKELSLTEENWSLVIEPQRGLLDLRLRELWGYRDLVMLFVRRDFVSVYKQTILGPLWYLIQPLLTTLTFTFIFGRIASLPTDGLPQFLFYMSGTVVWSYFAACLTKTSETFVQNANLFGKVYFPRMALPVPGPEHTCLDAQRRDGFVCHCGDGEQDLCRSRETLPCPGVHIQFPKGKPRNLSYICCAPEGRI